MSNLEANPGERAEAQSPRPGRRGTPLPRRSRANWILLASSYVTTTLGLAVAVATLLPERLVSPWPWASTDVVLVGACVFFVMMLVVFLSIEQRHLELLGMELVEFEKQAHQATRRRFDALLNVGRMMVQQTELHGVFSCMTRSCVEMFDCDQASVMLLDPRTQKLVVRSAHGHLDLSKVLGSEKRVGEGIAGWAAKNRQALILGGPHDSAKSHPELALLYKEISAAAVVPIILRDELVGVINISSRSSKVYYEEDDLHALQVFAENAGACIRHAEQAEWMRKTIAGLQEQVARAGEPART